MLSVLILGFVAGALAAAGVPNFVKGISGEKHKPIVGPTGSATESVIWGWLSLAIAAVVWHLAPMKNHPRAAFIGVAVGVLVMGLSLANANGKKKAAAKA